MRLPILALVHRRKVRSGTSIENKLGLFFNGGFSLINFSLCGSFRYSSVVPANDAPLALPGGLRAPSEIHAEFAPRPRSVPPPSAIVAPTVQFLALFRLIPCARS